jgi:hypothetical protein
MLTAYIPLARNRDIFLRASLVLLLHRAFDRVLRRVLAREHPGEAWRSLGEVKGRLLQAGEA